MRETEFVPPRVCLFSLICLPLARDSAVREEGHAGMISEGPGRLWREPQDDNDVSLALKGEGRVRASMVWPS